MKLYNQKYQIALTKGDDTFTLLPKEILSSSFEDRENTNNYNFFILGEDEEMIKIEDLEESIKEELVINYLNEELEDQLSVTESIRESRIVEDYYMR